MKVVLQVHVEPGTFGIGQQTVAASRRLDRHIPNERLEWYTKSNVCHAITGLLVPSGE